MLIWVSPQGTSTQGQATDSEHGHFWVSGLGTACEWSSLCRKIESCKLSPSLGFAGADMTASPSLIPVLCLWERMLPCTPRLSLLLEFIHEPPFAPHPCGTGKENKPSSCIPCCWVCSHWSWTAPGTRMSCTPRALYIPGSSGLSAWHCVAIPALHTLL